jgi:hypothetical protein
MSQSGCRTGERSRSRAEEGWFVHHTSPEVIRFGEVGDDPALCGQIRRGLFWRKMASLALGLLV